jgi:saccharopine dehydrogenase (NAD+, L-lysine-forming)
MKRTKIGILREGKVPPDKRVPLTPKQCRQLQELYPNTQVIVQSSDVRAFSDQEYLDQQIDVRTDISDCDYIFGVKEVNIADLIPNKKFVFFSHTIKKQPYNRNLLLAILEKHIQLIDYEVMKNAQGKRIIGFGRYAGIVGAYNGFRTLGMISKSFDLKPAHTCTNRKEMEAELAKVTLPTHYKIVLTGFGRVGHGAREILALLPIKEVAPEDFHQSFDCPVFTQLEVEDYYANKEGKSFDKQDFYRSPEQYISTFGRFVEMADMYIACHFWSNRSPHILTQSDLQLANRRLRIVADISCDVNGPIACTIRPSKIESAVYGYDPDTNQECSSDSPGCLAVMAVDNLPCELPRDASEDFGNELLKYIFPAMLVSDPDRIIERASETDGNGNLMPDFSYLADYVSG